MKKDINSNSLAGDIIALDTKNSLIRSDEKLIAALGIEDLVVVSTKDALLVAHKDRMEDVKKITDQLMKDLRLERELHREVIDLGKNMTLLILEMDIKLKRLTLKPGAKLSVQMHHHRSEHWIVVSGQARVYYGTESFVLKENESTYHGKEVIHSLENIGDIPLELIEVQVGEYLDEDDIVRFSDIYGRED